MLLLRGNRYVAGCYISSINTQGMDAKKTYRKCTKLSYLDEAKDVHKKITSKKKSRVIVLIPGRHLNRVPQSSSAAPSRVSISEGSLPQEL